MDNLIPNEEEERLLEQLSTDWWKENAPKRGIKNTRIEEARLTKSGVVAKLLLENDMTLQELSRHISRIRTLLDVKDEHTTDLREGGRASKVALAIRTRRVTDTMNMLWHPGITTLGVDTITGEEVDVAHDERTLIAGSSGSGKSWATRPLMARAVVAPDREPILIDGKGEEATVWCGICRTAVEPDEIIDLIDDLHDDMFRRKNLLAKHRLSVWDTDLGPQREMYVDEGRVVLAILAAHDKKLKKFEEGEMVMTPSLEKLIDLSSLGRSRGIVLNWATQYPTTSGANPGIDPQININIDHRFCLRVKSLSQAQVILDDDASYGPHLIPPGKGMRGHGYRAGHGPTLVRSWTVTNEIVRSLANRGAGGASVGVPAPSSGPPSGGSVLSPDEVVTSAEAAQRFGTDAKGAARILTDMMVQGLIGSRFDPQTRTFAYGKSLLLP